MATFNTLVISKIQRETSKAVSISFDVPESLKNTYAFEAGQYLTLKTKIDGQEIRRDYSISSSPRSNDLTVTIKEIENGTLAKSLFLFTETKHLKKQFFLKRFTI